VTLKQQLNDRERDKFGEKASGQTAVHTISTIDNDATNPVVISGSAGVAAPTGPFKITVGTATDVASDPLPIPLNNRFSLSIRNMDPVVTMYVGASPLVTADNASTGGWDVGPGEDFHLDLSDANAFYLITPTGLTALFKILEIASNAAGGTSVTNTQEQIVGTYDGVNTIFTTSQIPADPGAFYLYLNGSFQTQGVHYTLVSNVITMTTAPTASQVLDAVYTY